MLTIRGTQQLRQELLAARLELETKSNQILSLEAALQARPPLSADASEDEKTHMIAEQAKTIRELEIVVRGYEDNLGEPLRAVREDVEKEWEVKVEAERKLRLEKEAWANELVRQLEKEKKVCGNFRLHVVSPNSWPMFKLVFLNRLGINWKSKDEPWWHSSRNSTVLVEPQPFPLTLLHLRP
jgi:hypothetical protein